jgi:hypothetical protein
VVCCEIRESCVVAGVLFCVRACAKAGLRRAAILHTETKIKIHTHAGRNAYAKVLFFQQYTQNILAHTNIQRERERES